MFSGELATMRPGAVLAGCAGAGREVWSKRHQELCKRFVLFALVSSEDRRSLLALIVHISGNAAPHMCLFFSNEMSTFGDFHIIYFIYWEIK